MYNTEATEAPQFATHRVDELRPHPSYLKHRLSVPAPKISALDQLGDLALHEPIAVTQDRVIIDGHARWELAKSRKKVTIHCLEYHLTEDEALCYLLHKQRRSDGLNDFTRIELALDLEPLFRERARFNQQAGGRGKGSSTLPAAERVDSRKEIACVAGVSLGNVTKTKRILSNASLSVRQAARSGEISINIADKWTHESEAEQQEHLRLLRIERGIRRKARQLVSAHLAEPSACKANERAFKMSDLIRIANQLATIAPEESNELGSIEVNVLSSPGRAIFVTEELIQTLRSRQEVLIR